MGYALKRLSALQTAAHPNRAAASIKWRKQRIVGDMAKPAYFTICSKNYMAYALTLGRSLAQADPDAQFTIFLADDAMDAQSAAGVEFDVVLAAQLDLPNLADMALRYSIMEFNTAIKPACFTYLFDHCGAAAAIYLDPDILVLRPLTHVEAALADGAALVLTPHSLRPLDDGDDPDDLRLLRTGVYNLGFAAFANLPEARLFLDWWNARLAVDCRVALDDGIFVDQKWMDLAPSYVGATTILRHPGYNAAYWNLYGRAITRGGDGWRAAGEPLHFYHFSGVKPGDGGVFSKHQTRFTIDTIGALIDLLQTYLQQLELNGHARWSREPYAFAPPDDMKRVDEFVRAAFRRRRPAAEGGRCFDAGELETVCNERSVMLAPDAEPALTGFTYEVWAQRPDLRRLFDLSRRDDRERFNAWLLTSGVEEHEIPARLLAHITAPAAARQTLAAMPLRLRLINEALKRRGLVAPLVRRLPAAWLDASRRRLQALMSRGAPAAAQVEAPERPSVPLAVYGYFNAESGLGQAVRREFRALRSAGVPAVARPLGSDQFENRERFEFEFDAGQSDARIHLIHVNADQTAVSHTWADPEVFAEGRYRIGFWAWELEQFPSEWAAAFDKVDEIWTPSRFVAESVSQATGKPVRAFAHPVPVGEDGEERGAVRLAFALPEEAPVFLSIFDFNSFLARKNPKGVLDAFELARRSVPELLLVLKCHGGLRHDEDRKALFERARALGGVHIIDRVLDGTQLNRLYSACDGLISLHRSEGFGLTIAEAMAHAKAVIATNYSGNTDFFDADVGEPVGYTLTAVPAGAYPYGEGSKWADPDIEAAAAALVRLAADPQKREALGLAARARIAEQLSPDRIGREMAARLDEINVR